MWGGKRPRADIRLRRLPAAKQSLVAVPAEHFAPPGAAGPEPSRTRIRRWLPFLFARVQFAELSPFGVTNLANTNVLTIDASDPKSGTAEFKACAVRVELAAQPASPR